MRLQRGPHWGHWWLDRCFLYVGRIAETKGVQYILRAWLDLVERCGDYSPPLWLVGGLPHEIEAVRNQIGDDVLRGYEQRGQIRWWGYLGAAGISTLLLKTYVVVTHSLYEPGGRVVLEALRQGIPVIATPHGLAADLVVDWHTGFIVDHGDIAVLRRRMEHFAFQPLLRHAMGRVAQEVASAALHEWNFLEVHEQVYRQAIEGRLSSPSTVTTRSLVQGPNPQALGGVYPFESEFIGISEVTSFLIKKWRKPDLDPRQLSTSTGRSNTWIAEADSKTFVIKHAPTTYRRRPIWDQGFGGTLVEKQEGRIKNEVLAAKCQGVAPVLASCERSGLLLRPWLAPATIDHSNLELSASHLLLFHKSVIVDVNLNSLQADLHRDWRQMEDDVFIRELHEVEASWRSKDYWWHPWQPMSLRLGWKWLDLGLRRNWLSLPGELINEVLASLPREIAVAEKEVSESSFGFCHGDCDPDNFRLDERATIVLIDCERFHPGYFGSDWSTLVLRLLDDVHGTDSIVELIGKAAQLVEAALPARLFVSWLRWSVAMDLCRAHVLLNADALKSGIARWRQLDSISV